MSLFPDDIFTEPEVVDSDTLANLGPLRRLAGIWEGRKGVLAVGARYWACVADGGYSARPGRDRLRPRES